MTAPAHYGPKGKATKPVSAPKGRRGATHQERMTNDPRRSIPELDAAILDLLSAGPLMKWEIRDKLQEPEYAVHRRLLALKAAKRLKTVGKRLDKRCWALITWQSVARAAFNAAPKPKPQPKAETPKAPDSWWTNFASPDSSWTEFTEAAKQRDRAAGWTTHGDRTRPSAMEHRA